MIRLAVINEKGGVGKTFLACQFAMYSALKLNKRVLVLDFDSQGNTTKCLSNLAVKVNVTVTQLMIQKPEELEGIECGHEPFVIISADKDLKVLEREGVQAHYRFIGNIFNNLNAYFSDYDLIVMDTNPNDDVRSSCALCLATHVVTPIELAQESIDGVGSLIKRIDNIRNSVNPELDFIGFVPNRVEDKPLQKTTMIELVKHFSPYMLYNHDLKCPAHFKNCISIMEAQGDGMPLWQLKKSTAGKVWRNKVEPHFVCIAKRIGLID